MTRADLTALMESHWQQIQELNRRKGKDYAGDEDALSNFKEVAAELSLDSANTELAWAAGFFDGEGNTGCISATTTGGRGPRMKVGQVHRAPLERFAKAVGAGRISGPHKQPGNRNDMYHWTVNGTYKVYLVLRLLWPYLSEIKKNQAREAFKTTLACRKSKPGDLRAKPFPNIDDLDHKPRFSPLDIWAVYANKHWRAIATFCSEGKVESEAIEGRIHDFIVYCFLLLGLVKEGYGTGEIIPPKATKTRGQRHSDVGEQGQFTEELALPE